MAAGITPAWAGKRRAIFSYSGSPGDHPRMGGEKSRKAPKWRQELGSPPHGRGKAHALHPTHVNSRITPAWAGKRATPRKNGCPGGDHPRMGGEKNPPPGDKTGEGGSPPHGRGKGGHFSGRVRPDGITPAWAGKSTWSPSFKDLRQDHPRMGGEKAVCRSRRKEAAGSPPHGRGKAAV